MDQNPEPSQSLIEWQNARAGKFTSSGISPLFVKGKGEMFGAGAKTYIRKKAHEILTGNSADGGEKFKQTEWGNKNEAEACEMFEAVVGKGIYYGNADPKFFELNDWAGGSPDWESIDIEWGADFKCPYDGAEHLNNLLINSQAEFKKEHGDYYDQGQMNMKIRGWKRFYFVSYDPRMINPALRLKIIEVLPDPEWIVDFDLRLPAAVSMLKAYVDQVKKATTFVKQGGENIFPTIDEHVAAFMDVVSDPSSFDSNRLLF